MLICFNGIDGSGKSLQAQRLVERLNQTGYPAVYVWSGGRSPVMRPLIRLGQRLLHAPGVVSSNQPRIAMPDATHQYQVYLTSTKRLFHRPLVRNAWLLLSLIEHAGEIWAAILPHLMRGRIVVCDRYIYDTVVGVAVLSGINDGHLSSLLRFTALVPVPRLDKMFFIDVPTDVAFSRKEDIPSKLFLEHRVPLYRYLAQRLEAQFLDGTATPDELATTIWRSVQPLLPPVPKAA